MALLVLAELRGPLAEAEGDTAIAFDDHVGAGHDRRRDEALFQQRHELGRDLIGTGIGA